MDGWAFLSENDDQLIFCRAAITHDMYLSLSQPIKHRKFIKILSPEVITNDRVFHLNVLVLNTVLCLRDPQGEPEREGYQLGACSESAIGEHVISGAWPPIQLEEPDHLK